MCFKNRSVLNTLVFLLFFFLPNIGSSQVVSLDYYLSYDSTTCWYDFNIIILAGTATSIPQRTQFNSQISFVIPMGTTIAFEDKYLPLENNFGYTGTIPMNWSMGTSISNPAASPGNDFISIVPKLSPTSQYNNIAVNDTLKLFSVSVAGAINCGEGIRLYENGVDPDSNDPGMDGADFSNGFTMGGVAQLYNENAPQLNPLPPTILELTDNSGADIDINLETSGSACQGSIVYSWSGPDGFSAATEDVFISPALPANFGTYEVIITDAIGCADTTTILVEEEGGPIMNEIVVGDLIFNPTFENMSVHLNISGDDNHNSTFLLEYKLTGTDTYALAAESMRAFPEMIVDGGALEENFHAASAMFLQPNSNYDFRITVTDPDGGGTVVETSYATKEVPAYPEIENTIYVVPGNGGGNGTQANPYQGIQAAANNAMPGDVIEVADGSYAPFTLTNSGSEDMPIVIRSTNLHGAVIDGGNTSAGIVTIGSFSDSIQHIIIDGFEIKNGSWGIDAQNTQFLTVQNNKINDVDFGFYNRRENGWEHDQYLTNNEIIGRTPWPQTNGEIPGERGIDIRGNRNVISHNSISDFGDGISTDGAPYKVSYALDIHNNYVNRVVDDLIEVDGILSNARVYNNRGYNGRMGVSLAPIFGGPAYVFRNEFYNLESSTFKMNRSPAGLYIVHNTTIKEGRGMTSDAGWQNTVFKNNVMVSSHYSFEEYDLTDGSLDDWNYNSYKSLRAGTTAQPWFKWDNVKYNNVTALSASGLLGMNSQAIELNDFVNVVVPTSYATEAVPINVDMTLSFGSDMINSGTGLDNIQLPYVTDGIPDAGVYEYGQPIPDYGHDFDAVCARIDLSLRTWNGEINTGWFHPDNWTPCGVPTRVTNVVIPSGSLHYPIVNSNVLINNLSILEGGRLDIKSTSPLIKLVGE